MQAGRPHHKKAAQARRETAAPAPANTPRARSFRSDRPVTQSALELPPLTAADRGRVTLLYHFVRLQMPAVKLAEPAFLKHLDRTFRIFAPKVQGAVTWA